MAKTGEELVNEIQQDLACPKCEYNLRGLRGAVVSCPECGETCDVAKLTSMRWTKPWHKAPGLTDMFLPITWVVFGAMGGAVISSRAGWEALTVFTVVWLAGWVWLMWRAWNVFQSAEGVYLALAAHVILVGYLLGVFGLLSGVGGFLISLLDDPMKSNDLLWAAVWSLVVVVSIVCLRQCHRAEAFVGKRCIRRYLAKRGWA